MSEQDEGKVLDDFKDSVIKAALQAAYVAGVADGRKIENEECAKNETVAITAEEYEVLRLIQFYARHEPHGDTLKGKFIQLDKIDKAKTANAANAKRRGE